MQDGMILNQMTNHVREIILELRTEYIDVPDTLVQIMDSYARYQTGGVMGHSVSIPALLSRAKALFYNDLDEMESIEDATQVERHFAYWKHLYVPIALRGTLLKQTTGVTTTQLIAQNGSLGHMNADHRLMLLNLFKSEYETAAAGIQGKKVAAAHGHYLNLEPEETQRAPETLENLFNEDGDYHGIGPDALGSWDNEHIWAHRPLGNTGTDAEQRLRNRPQIYEFASGVVPSIAGLDPVLRRLNMVVNTPKLGVMWDDGFSALVGDILGKNLAVPQLTMGGAGWEYDIDCVKIAGTTIIADPNTPEQKLRILNVGMPGLMNGTIFPYYYDPETNPVDAFAQQAMMKSLNMGRPKGMSFGRPRPTPYQGTEWSRLENLVDAVGTRVLLDYIPFLCTVRGHQAELRFQV